MGYKIVESFEEEPCRWRFYAVLAVVLFAVANILVLLKPHYEFVVGDGRWYYAYLPSLVIDGDLDLSNQVAKHWGVDFKEGLLTELHPATGLLHNKYSVGMALTLLPGFVISHLISLLLFSLSGSPLFTPDGYSVLYQLGALISVMGLGLLGMVLCDRLLSRKFALSGVAVWGAVTSFWTISHYSYYYFREPLMAHTVSAFWVVACFYLGARISRNISPTIAVGLMLAAFGMALVVRPSNVFVLPFVLSVFVSHLFSVNRRELLVLLGFVLLSLIPFALQSSVWHVMAGRWLYYSYNDPGFLHWKSPFLWSTLFSTNHGLFFWSPLLIMAVAGYVRELRARGGAFLWLGALGALILWYLNSSFFMWWFGDSFGGRAFLELAPLFILGLGFVYDRVARGGARTRLPLILFLAGCFIYNYSLMALYIARFIPREGPLF